MAVIFKAEDHSYTSVDTEEKIDWVGVTTLISNFKKPFDAEKQSVKSSKNKNSKWFGLSPEEIRRAWEAESKRATDLGTFYHNQREEEILMFETIEREGLQVPIIKPIVDGDAKYAPEQKLQDGVYPEHLVYLKSAGVCGQSDRVEVVRDVVSITDYKTNKEIKMEGYRGWDGSTQKMTGPVSHLDDCHFYHYALQLSVYLYIILKHNPALKPGKLVIDHVTFEEAGKDHLGYPVTFLDMDGDPIIKEVKSIEVPYLRDEVIAIFQWLKDNRQNLRKK
jgi:hypothetical protein